MQACWYTRVSFSNTEAIESVLITHMLFTTRIRMFYDCKLWLHPVKKSQYMTNEGPKEDDVRGDWVYSLPTNRFGHQSYKYIRWLGRIKRQKLSTWKKKACLDRPWSAWPSLTYQGPKNMTWQVTLRSHIFCWYLIWLWQIIIYKS